MPLHETETRDLIAELLKRISPTSYRTHKPQLDSLCFRIGVEQQEADLSTKQR